MQVPAKHQMAAVVLGALLAAALLLLLVAGNRVDPSRQEMVSFTEVQIARPPPPPPPPPANTSTDSQADPALDLDLAAVVDSPVNVLTRDSNIQVPAGELVAYGIGDFDQLPGLTTPVFDFSALDATPAVISSPPLAYPRSLRNKGVETFRTLLHIRIDQNGAARLIQVLETDYPELNSNMADYVSRVRFTPPTVGGVPVTADFQWPVVHTLTPEAQEAERLCDYCRSTR